MKTLMIFFWMMPTIWISAQSYTSYFTGATNDVVSIPDGGVCMMGGASEHDEAMKWFLQRANGGDILVLRASGSDGYNDYMFTDLGITVNSVETIVFNNASAANESYIHTKIANAEAIWFAGGDQWDYVSYWRNTPIDSLVNAAMLNRNIVIGGTSAGMAILGKFYFSAQNGTVTSATALNDPYNFRVTVDSLPFLQVNHLQDVVTDTHYDDPDRKGRHITFLARILTDYGTAAKGIACNEYTAVCIDENGNARVYGDYPNYPETAFFLQTNCELPNYAPETCSASTPLDWNLSGTAIRVYKVHGTNNGANSFELSDWQTGNGGSWENWYVDNGNLIETIGTQVNCTSVSVEEILPGPTIQVYPDPFIDKISISSDAVIADISLIDMKGCVLFSKEGPPSLTATMDGSYLPAGLYVLRIRTSKGTVHQKVIKAFDH